MKLTAYRMAIVVAIASLFILAKDKPVHNEEMISLLSGIDKTEFTVKNNFCPEEKLNFYDSLVGECIGLYDSLIAEYYIGNAWLEMGEEQK